MDNDSLYDCAESVSDNIFDAIDRTLDSLKSKLDIDNFLIVKSEFRKTFGDVLNNTKGC